jgi:polysaccharide biosynthesis transport protein
VPQIEKLQFMSASGPETPASLTVGERFDFVAGFLRRRYLVITVSLLLSLALGASYLLTAPKTYTASAIMIIEPRKGALVLQDSLANNAPPDSAWIETQIGVLKSLNVLGYVVKQLRLAEDPQFIRGDAWSLDKLLDKLLARLGWDDAPEPNTDAERVGAATAALIDGLNVQRVGLSYMMRIDFSSQNSAQAVKVANAMIDAYIFDQLNAKYQANRRAGDWLQERLQTLREQAAAAERAVIEFKAKNNIVTAAGTLMNDKRLADMSAQLATARANTTDLQIRLERIDAVRQAHQQDKPSSAADETTSEAMSSAIINKLRDRYLDLVNREADWSVKYGKNHTAVVNLRDRIRDMRRSIFDELGRIEEQYKSEYEIAKKRQDELEKGLTKLVSQSTETNQAQVALFSLEAAAQSYRKIYDSFLQRHTESVQQQSFPISDARPISPASITKTTPRALRVWIVTIFAGGMLGVGLGALREMRDRGFRTREQVQSVLATECLALVPLVANRKRFFSGSRSLALPPARKAELAVGTQMAPRSIPFASKVMRTIVDSPSSHYAEAIRSIKLSVDLNGQVNNNIIGVTSCLPSEGKSSLAASMATLIAQGGARVILVDCDLRHPSLSRALAPDASAGFLDVVAGKLDLADAIWTDQGTGMSFLPAGDPAVPHATEILASDDAKVLFSTLQVRYDYVIVDLAPLVAGVDVRASSRFVDSYVLVIEWGVTTVDAVQYALRHAPAVQANIVGAVLNKVNVAAMSRYDRYGANYYHHDKVRHPRVIN